MPTRQQHRPSACAGPARSSAPFIPAGKRTAFKFAYRPYIDRAALRGRAAIEQMADDFLTFAVTAGSICEADLEILGWSRAQITLHASDARAHANASAAG